jgi:hypothetical protein
LDLGLLFTIPSNKDEIRHRLNSCLDYFAKIRASEFGLNSVNLRQALPDVAFFDELPYEINEEAIFSGKIFLEMIVFHEFTHAFDRRPKFGTPVTFGWYQKMAPVTYSNP